MLESPSLPGLVLRTTAMQRKEFKEQRDSSVRQAAVDADAARLAILPAKVVEACDKLQRALETKRLDLTRLNDLSEEENKVYRLEDVGLVTARTYLLYASDTGAQILARTALEDDGGLEKAEAFGKTFFNEVIVKIIGCARTPSPTPGGSLAMSNEEEAEEETHSPAAAPRKREGQSTLRNGLLRIHCGRCPVSDAFAEAWECFETPPVPAYLVDFHMDTRMQHPDSPVDGLIASHILRFALGTTDSRLDLTWDLLQDFIGQDIKLSAYRNKIQATANAVLFSLTADAQFKKFKLWFEPDLEAFDRKNPNAPFSCTVHSRIRQVMHWPERVTFRHFCYDSGQRRSGYDLPDPYLLRLHASLGRVMSASGMAEYVEELWREREEMDDLLTEGRWRDPTDVVGWGADVARALGAVDTGD